MGGGQPPPPLGRASRPPPPGPPAPRPPPTRAGWPGVPGGGGCKLLGPGPGGGPARSVSRRSPPCPAQPYGEPRLAGGRQPGARPSRPAARRPPRTHRVPGLGVEGGQQPGEWESAEAPGPYLAPAPAGAAASRSARPSPGEAQPTGPAPAASAGPGAEPPLPRPGSGRSLVQGTLDGRPRGEGAGEGGERERASGSESSRAVVPGVRLRFQDRLSSANSGAGSGGDRCDPGTAQLGSRRGRAWGRPRGPRRALGWRLRVSPPVLSELCAPLCHSASFRSGPSPSQPPRTPSPLQPRGCYL
ncbi:basic salivary proline-rich protein 2-like [Antechinus flavipes]|uniref:basic salivary proline-rich protein 2-like n=1 Tax=Antechinus flavipes TaxID=38775 RepID=UPI0022365CE6|nr:basic salivary proline-rich protein 2-like [Antechinus flavipes]